MRRFLAAQASSAARVCRSSALPLAALLSSSLLISTASAAPSPDPSLGPSLGTAATAQWQTTDDLQPVAWVCGPYRCWWGPGPYWGGPYWRGRYWGPGPYYWGWRGRWY
jgi:hypothetical protein